MMKLRSIRNSLSLIAGQGAAQLASAVTFMILARGLGVEKFGTLATLYGASLFSSVFIEFGASSFATRELSGKRSAWRFPGQYRFRQAMTACFLVPALLMAIIFPSMTDIGLCVGLAFLSAQGRFLASPVRAALHMGRLAIISAAEKISVLGAMLVLSSFGQVSGTQFLQVTLLAALMSCLALRASWSPRYAASVKHKGEKRFVNPFAGLRHLGLSSVAVGLQSLDSVAIAATAGPLAAGVYAAVGRWTQPLSLVTQAVTQSAYGEMARMRKHSDAFSSLRINLGLLSLASVPLVLVFLFADFLTGVLLGPEYTASAQVLRVLSGAVLFGVVNSPFSALLQARGDESFTSKLFLAAMPLQLISMCFLAWFGGALLGAVAVLVVQGLLAVIFVFRVRWLLQNERAEAKRAEAKLPAGSPRPVGS
jgi:O-antigen/teichoic acid export membrane protein